MERASTIRALPLLPETGPELAGMNGADGKATGKQASLPQLEDAAKVGAGCCFLLDLVNMDRRTRQILLCLHMVYACHALWDL